VTEHELYEEPGTSIPVPIPDGGVIAQLLTLLVLEAAGMRKGHLVEALWLEPKNPPASPEHHAMGLAADHQKEIGEWPRCARVEHQQTLLARRSSDSDENSTDPRPPIKFSILACSRMAARRQPAAFYLCSQPPLYFRERWPR
jgi:hypothetical protein